MTPSTDNCIVSGMGDKRGVVFTVGVEEGGNQSDGRASWSWPGEYGTAETAPAQTQPL